MMNKGIFKKMCCENYEKDKEIKKVLSNKQEFIEEQAEELIQRFNIIAIGGCKMDHKGKAQVSDNKIKPVPNKIKLGKEAMTHKAMTYEELFEEDFPNKTFGEVMREETRKYAETRNLMNEILSKMYEIESKGLVVSKIILDMETYLMIANINKYPSNKENVKFANKTVKTVSADEKTIAFEFQDFNWK